MEERDYVKKREKANCHLDSMMVALPRELVPKEIRSEKPWPPKLEVE